MKVWILLPAYNEEKSFPVLLPKIKDVFDRNKMEYAVVIVDDGSTDNSRGVINSYSTMMPINIVVHEINRGLGETERDGFEFIAKMSEEEDVIIRLDCDDTHEPQYMFDMLEQIYNGYDVVSASRFEKGGRQEGLNLYRKTISYAANIFMKVVFNIKGIKDYSCGYRAYKAKVIKDAIHIFGNGFIQLRGLGFTSTLEMIVKLNLMGCKFKEIPFTLRYDNKKSPSKMVSSITTLGYFTMATLYHWPFGGWRQVYKKLCPIYNQSSETAIEKYTYKTFKRSSVSKIGL